MLKLKSLFLNLGVAVQIFVLGELLFIAVATLYAMQTGSQVFRYSGY